MVWKPQEAHGNPLPSVWAWHQEASGRKPREAQAGRVGGGGGPETRVRWKGFAGERGCMGKLQRGRVGCRPHGGGRGYEAQGGEVGPTGGQTGALRVRAALEMGLRLFGGRYCLRAHSPGHRLPSDLVIALQQERGHVDVQRVEGQGGYWFALIRDSVNLVRKK